MRGLARIGTRSAGFRCGCRPLAAAPRPKRAGFSLPGWIALLLAITAAPAESRSLISWDVGVKGGWASSTVKGAELPDASVGDYNGIIAGAVGRAHIGEYFALQLEGLYAQKGADIDLTTREQGALRLTYLQFPLLATAFLPFKENYKAYASAGMAVSINTNADLTSESSRQDLDDQVKGTDTNAVLALGLDVFLESFYGTVEFRYDWGLPTIGTIDGSNLKNRTYSLIFGFSLPLNKVRPTPGY